MKWFGWRAGREESRPALSRAGSAAAVWPPSYEAQVRSGYAANPVAQRAVRLVAETLGGAPLSASDDRAAALVRARIAGARVIETAAMQLMLHGNAFVQLLRAPDGAVEALFPLRPERVRVSVDAGGWPAGYVYRVGERTMRLAAEEVIHLRTPNPLDDHYGMGCLAAAAQGIAIHNAAGQWSRALLDNAARPSGALVYDPGDGSVLTGEQVARLREEMEAAFAGAGNAGRPMLLEGGLKWQALSLSPADLDFAGTKAAAAREIALAFGVPPLLLGLAGDNTHANYREANRALWRLAVLPMADVVLGGIAERLGEWFPGLTIEVDLDQVPAMLEERSALWRFVTAADFITRDEKRQMVGWGA